LQIQVTNLDYSDYLGRLAIARVFQRKDARGAEVGIARLDGTFSTRPRSRSCFPSPA
jgi:GTP-binding protein